jgi:hypothetical protein
MSGDGLSQWGNYMLAHRCQIIQCFTRDSISIEERSINEIRFCNHCSQAFELL